LVDHFAVELGLSEQGERDALQGAAYLLMLAAL
jgi:hypothetical protein